MKIDMVVNGENISLDIEASRRLIDVLRDNLHLSGTKQRCRQGICGACFVLVDGRLCAACMTPVGLLNGSEIVTIEKFEKTPEYDDISQAIAKRNLAFAEESRPFLFFSIYEIVLTHSSASKEMISDFYANFSQFNFDLATLHTIAALSIANRKKRLKNEKNAAQSALSANFRLKRRPSRFSAAKTKGKND